MNIFRLLGDLSHLLAIIILLLKIWKSRSCAASVKVAAGECAWLTSLVQDLIKLKTPNLQGDNEITLNVTKNLEKHTMVKHIQIKQFFLSEPKTEVEPTVIPKVSSDHKLTDNLKMPLRPKLNIDCKQIGISGKSQILFAVVYTTRYLDLLTTYVSTYNTVMKLVFIVASYATVYLMYIKFKATYDHNHDTFRIEFLLVPCLILSLLINHEFTFMEILWTFSIYLESVAILPQLFLVSKTGEAESITSHYLFALGSYRALYLLNWVYRYVMEDHYEVIAIVAGIIQTVLYCDFFYLYITKVLKGKKLQLPA